MEMFGDDDAFDVFGEQPKARVAPKRALSTADESEAAEKRSKTSTAPVEAEARVPAGAGAGAFASKQEEDLAERAATGDEFGVYVEQKIKTNHKADEGCVAEVCYPPNFDFEAEAAAAAELAAHPKPPSKPAKTYPFVLDPFQRHAVNCLENNQSVLVSAHTSAGKTVVAEYAIAMSLRDVQRVIYTSPIKALSNQKYRELYEEFEDVGLMTGDITINPSASCLVMTTEILRNMLYRGSEVMREVAWVVFDEIHYMRDKARGVVWEETLIMLPDKVRYVFLSATIPNAREFACWIAKLHKQPCNVVYTDYRPTPLQHYVFPAGGDGLHLAVDEKGNFRDDNFARALAVMQKEAAPEEAGMGSKKGPKKKSKKDAGDIYKIVKMIMDKHYEPVIIFSFSKKDCETHALQMSKLDFSDADEKKLIEQIFHNAIDSLSDDDKHLPQVENVLPLLKRGIGIHHGGLLPILKEVIEILFQEGLLKALFATETFAMGLNMPARTVVFTGVRKFDGADYRVVSGGEYIQMSGRAGRRGLDDRGIVIMMMDNQLEPAQCKEMLQGQADRLCSSFHLGYNMLLNLLRVEEADPEYMMARSFHQFQQNMRAPELKKKLEALEGQHTQMEVPDASAVAEYCNVRSVLEECRVQLRNIINQPLNVLPFLNPGRLVKVVDGPLDWGWGVIINFQKKKTKAEASVDGSGVTYIVDVMLNCKATGKHKDKATSQDDKPEPCPAGEKGELQVVPVMLGLFHAVSSIRLFIPKDLRSREARKSIGKSLKEVRKRFPNGVPELDPIEDLKIQDEGLVALVRKIEQWEARLLQHRLHESEGLADKVAAHERKAAVGAEITQLQTEIKSASQDVIMKATLKNMKRVLRRLGHTTANNVIDLKGRVACEISTCDELLGTELMFSGVFQELTPAQTVALCSCLVTEDKSDSAVKLKEELAAPLRKMQECAKRILGVMADAKMPVDAEEYLGRFQSTMMDVTYSWCKGAKFSEVCKMTDIFEGSIIRIMRRLEELLRQMAVAAKSIGNTELEEKFSAGILLLKRDIVFAASLYL